VTGRRSNQLNYRPITKVPVNRQELHLRGKYSAYLRLRDTGIKAGKCA